MKFRLMLAALIAAAPVAAEAMDVATFPAKADTLERKGMAAMFTGDRAIPAAQRPRLQVKDGLRSQFARKYPCAR